MERNSLQTQIPVDETCETIPPQAPDPSYDQQQEFKGVYGSYPEGKQEQLQQPYGYQQQQTYDREYQQPYSMLAPGDVSPYERTSMGMRACTAGWLSYLGGWVTGLIFFLLERENRFVRFHAMQSLIFFGAMTIVTTVFNYIPFFGFIGAGLGFVSFICWIVLMVAAHRGRYYKLPVIGDYAEKWASQIRI
jgi:uncharacterized membrane protein